MRASPRPCWRGPRGPPGRAWGHRAPRAVCALPRACWRGFELDGFRFTRPHACFDLAWCAPRLGAPDARRPPRAPSLSTSAWHALRLGVPITWRSPGGPIAWGARAERPSVELGGSRFTRPGRRLAPRLEVYAPRSTSRARRLEVGAPRSRCSQADLTVFPAGPAAAACLRLARPGRRLEVDVFSSTSRNRRGQVDVARSTSRARPLHDNVSTLTARGVEVGVSSSTAAALRA